MRILVTGSSGFIGKNLVRALKDRGDEIFEFDIERDPDQDIAARVHWHGGIDHIYNLACPASPVHYQKDPIRTTKASVLGALRVLELAVFRPETKVLQASTSEIYGDPLEHPQTESYWGNVNPIGPRSCYDEGKRCAESLFMDYHRVHKVKIKIARIFNTYGPFMKPDDGRVVSNFIVSALKNEDLVIHGDGHQVRSFCYVDDMVDGLIKLMESDDTITGPINLGNPEECTILNLAGFILHLTKSSSRIVFKPKREDDPCKRCPEILRAIALLDWIPTTNLETGLEKTIDYFKTVI